MNTILEILRAVPSNLVDDVAELLTLIIKASDSKAAIAKAKQALITDAADAATDAALTQALKAGL